MVVEIPPLRARAGDAALLAHTIIRRLADQQGKEGLTLAEDALKSIESHGWPGNVRELENCLKRAVILADGQVIRAEDLGLATDEGDHRYLNLRQVREEAERAAVLRAMAHSDGNIARAAEILGISRPTLYDLLNRFSLR
jgi:two-component system NtrC family response regulator